MKRIRVAALLPLLAAFAAHAQPAGAADEHAAHHEVSAAAEPISQGEVRRINLEQGKLTLRHGPLTNLDMPPMTMVFTVADRAMLQGLQVGDKVRFTAEDRAGVLTIVALRRGAD